MFQAGFEVGCRERGWVDWLVVKIRCVAIWKLYPRDLRVAYVMIEKRKKTNRKKGKYCYICGDELMGYLIKEFLGQLSSFILFWYFFSYHRER